MNDGRDGKVIFNTKLDRTIIRLSSPGEDFCKSCKCAQFKEEGRTICKHPDFCIDPSSDFQRAPYKNCWMAKK